MIQLTGAAKRFGPKTLFENLDWLVTPNERAGIVGANGTGKSTLLKILAGMDGLDAGTIVTMKGASVGYLPQEGLSLSGRTVFAECMTVFADLLALEQEQETLAHKLSELDPAGPEYAQVADRFHRAEGDFRARDGFAIEAQVGMVLSGLGFPQRQWTKRTEEFSGGWQMRIALAKLLLEKPNLLLLDEPTNHLDLEARNWLEGYLAAYPHAFVLVSHDRYFLDVTVRKLLELWNKGVHFYTGGYSRYEQQKAERLSPATSSRKPNASRSSKPPTPTSRTASPNWKPSSTASVLKLPRRSRGRAASRSWSASSASKFRPRGPLWIRLSGVCASLLGQTERSSGHGAGGYQWNACGRRRTRPHCAHRRPTAMSSLVACSDPYPNSPACHALSTLSTTFLDNKAVKVTSGQGAACAENSNGGILCFA